MKRLTHKTLECNGLQFAYLEKGSGPLVLFVHGFPDTAHTWDRAMTATANAGFRAVAVFTRGYAPSEVPQQSHWRFDADTLGSDILGWLDVLSPSEPAIIMGHDWGASAAYSAAAIAPKRIRLLITMAIPHPAALKPSLGLLWAGRHFLKLQLPGAAKRIRANNFSLIDTLWKRWSAGWDVPPAETMNVKEALSQPGSLEAALAYYAAFSPKLPDSHKKRVDVPTVCFAGRHDVIEVEQYERARSRFNKDYEIIEMDGGHFMHRQYPDVFEDNLIRVLARYR